MYRPFETVREVEKFYCKEICYRNKIYYIVGAKIEGNSILVYLTELNSTREVKVMSNVLLNNALCDGLPVGVKV